MINVRLPLALAFLVTLLFCVWLRISVKDRFQPLNVSQQMPALDRLPAQAVSCTSDSQCSKCSHCEDGLCTAGKPKAEPGSETGSEPMSDPAVPAGMLPLCS